MSASPDTAALKVSNVLWLMAAMAFVIAPHAGRLPIWVSVACIAAAIWRGLIAWNGWKMPHWALVGGLALASAAGTWLSYSRLYGRDASSTLLIIMLCLKLLEMRSRRDALLTVFLGFFLVFTNFLYSQTVVMGLYMLLCVWIFMSTLVGFNRVGTEATFRERAAPAGKILLQAIPLMLVVFILSPVSAHRFGACRKKARRAEQAFRNPCHRETSTSSSSPNRSPFARTSRERYPRMTGYIGADRSWPTLTVGHGTWPNSQVSIRSKTRASNPRAI